MRYESKYTTAESFPVSYGKSENYLTTRSYITSFSRVEVGKTVDSNAVDNETLTTSHNNSKEVKNTQFLNEEVRRTTQAEEQVDGVNQTQQGGITVARTYEYKNNSSVVHTGEWGQTNIVTTTVNGETQTSRVETGDDFDNGYEINNETTVIGSAVTKYYNVRNESGASYKSTVSNVVNGEVSSSSFSTVFENTSNNTFKVAVRENYNSTYTKEFSINNLPTTINYIATYPDKNTFSISNGSYTTTGTTTVINFVPCKTKTFIPSVFTYTYEFFGESFGTQTEEYELPSGGRQVGRYTINTFVEDYHNELERFQVFNYAGAYSRISPFFKFSQCLKTTAGQYKWTDKGTSINMGSFSISAQVGSGNDSVVSFEIIAPTTINYEDTINLTRSDDSTFRIQEIRSFSLIERGSSGGVLNNVNKEYGVGTRSGIRSSYSIVKEVILLKSDPKNFTTTEIDVIKKFDTTFASNYINNITSYFNPEDSSSAFSTDYSTAGEWESRDGDNYIGKSYQILGQEGYSFSVSEAKTFQEFGTNSLGQLSNVFFENYFGGYYAIVPEFKAGVIGFNSEKLYEYVEISYNEQDVLTPKTSSYLYRNKNQTKVLGLACLPFVDYETASITKIGSTNNPISFASTGYDSNYETDGETPIGSYTSSYFLDALSTKTISTTILISYLPEFTTESSIINDKNLKIYYTVYKKDGESRIEQKNTLNVLLLNSCSNLSNFRRDNSFLGGYLPESSQSWTLFYKGHLFATKYASGSSQTLEFFNTSLSYSQSIFANGEALVCNQLPVYEVGRGLHTARF